MRSSRVASRDFWTCYQGQSNALASWFGFERVFFFFSHPHRTYLTGFLAGFDPCAVERPRDSNSRDGARKNKTLVVVRRRHSEKYGYYIPIRQSYRSPMSCPKSGAPRIPRRNPPNCPTTPPTIQGRRLIGVPLPHLVSRRVTACVTFNFHCLNRTKKQAGHNTTVAPHLLSMVL